MKPIYVLLVFVLAFSSFLAEAVGDQLQNDCYWCRSDYNYNIWSFANSTKVNESEACNQTIPADGTIQFDSDFGLSEEDCHTYRWNVSVDGYDVNVTINYLDLDESAGNYLIISPGPSLVQDEASVVITGKIQTPKMIRVFGYSEMTLLLVIQEGITNETWTNNSFKLSYKAYGPTTEQPTTTTTKPTHNTPSPDVDYDITVYVSSKRANELSNKTLEFKSAVAKMANKYCNDTSITLLTATQAENVELLRITTCPRTWPNAEKCTEILMTVEVSVPPGNDYELTRKHLEKMWNKYAQEELEPLNLQVYSVPDAKGTLYIWLYISLGVAAIFTLLMIALWHFDVFNIGNKKGAQTQQDPHKTSNTSNKSWVSNNSYQEVPPIFEDTDIQPPTNQETAAPPNAPPAPHGMSPSLDQYGAAFYFQNRVSNIGYDNPSFDVSSEQHHPSNADYTDDFSSDEDSRTNTSKDKKSNHDHLHKAPQEVAYKDDKESAF